MIELLKVHAPDPPAVTIAPAAPSPDEVLKRKQVDEELKSLKARNAELYAQNAQLKAAKDQCETKIDQLERQNERLLERIGGFKEEVGQFKRQMNAAAASSSPAKVAPPPAPTPAPTSAMKKSGAPSLSADLRRLLDKVFVELLDDDGNGKIANTRIFALVQALDGKGDGKGAQGQAMRALTAILQTMHEEHKAVTKETWTEYMRTLPDVDPDEWRFTPEQQQRVCAMLEEVFKRTASTDGMRKEVARLEEELTGARGFHGMMSDLASKILIPPNAPNGTRHIHRTRIAKLAGILDAGSQESEDELEKNAMRAFVRELEFMAKTEFWTLDEWKAATPKRTSFTPEEQDLFVVVLLTVLSNDDACDGLNKRLGDDGVKEAAAETKRVGG